MILNNNSTANKRDLIFSALKAEGVPALYAGYQNIHLNPLFKNRIAYGTKSFPWIGLERGASKIFYKKGSCPVAEKLHNQTFLGIGLCHHIYTDEEVDLIIDSFRKVWKCLNL